MIEIDLEGIQQALPPQLTRFLKAADARISDFVRAHPSSYRGFVPSDYVAIYHALQCVSDRRLSCGDRFCEWGSGFGVVASMAAMAGYEAFGIEIDQRLCDAAENLADEFEVDVEFVRGSFIPPGAESLIDDAFHAEDGSLSLETSADDAYDELGLDVADFDLLFVYPWPSDEQLTLDLFEKYAADGALLLTYDETHGARLYRR